MVGKLLEKDQYSYGFDAQNGEYGNLMTKGIIDPTKVVRAAIQNAASVAGLLITTEAMVAELPKKKDAMPAMPPAAAWISKEIHPSGTLTQNAEAREIPGLLFFGSRDGRHRPRRHRSHRGQNETTTHEKARVHPASPRRSGRYGDKQYTSPLAGHNIRLT